MRRKDREITDTNRIESIIANCCCCRIGFNDDGKVYIVPLNFGYEINDGKYVFYFHGAKEGRKIRLIEKNPFVGFEMDTNYQLKPGGSACGYTAQFQSVIGTGTVVLMEDEREKEAALQLLMRHNAGKDGWEFSREMMDSVSVFKLIVEELSCKEHL